MSRNFFCRQEKDRKSGCVTWAIYGNVQNGLSLNLSVFYTVKPLALELDI